MDTLFMKERIIDVVEDFDNTQSIKLTAQNMGYSTGTVRKMLLTAGVWSNKTANDIAIIRREEPELSTLQIAEKLKLSKKAVQLYTPYEGLANMAETKNNTDKQSDEMVDCGDCGDKAVWTLTKSGKLTISGSGPMWDYNGNCFGFWTSPRPKWWARRDGIKVKSIEIEEGITTIGQYAFSNLIDLASVKFSTTIVEIKGGAFCGENHVKKIVIPEKVTYIAWDTFYSNIWLEEIHVPAGVFKIQTYAFHACMSLERMYFYGDAPRTAPSAFDMCHEGAITIYHKEFVKSWGEVWNGYRTEVFL